MRWTAMAATAILCSVLDPQKTYMSSEEALQCWHSFFPEVCTIHSAVEGWPPEFREIGSGMKSAKSRSLI